MQTHEAVRGESFTRRLCRSIRRSGAVKVASASLAGVALLGVSPSGLGGMASAAESETTPYIWIARINGEFAVQGRHFPGNVHNAVVTASLGDQTGKKTTWTFDSGYSWTTFWKFTPDMTGKATATIDVNGVTASTSTYLAAGDSAGTPTDPGTAPAVPADPATPAAPADPVAPVTPAKPTTTTTTSTTTTTLKPDDGYQSAGNAPTTGSKGTSTGSSSNSGSCASGKSYDASVSDDFSGSSLDRSKWGTYDGEGNQGHGRRSSSAVSVANNELRINGSGTTAGGVASREGFGPGSCITVRAKADKGAGFGSAILLWPQSPAKWPDAGEYDLSEIPKGDRSWSGTFSHYGPSNKQKAKTTKADFSQWHEFSLKWEGNSLTYYVDGNVVLSVNNSETPGIVSSAKHFLALQFDVGASGAFIPPRDGSTPSNVVWHVDYVKVYR